MLHSKILIVSGKTIMVIFQYLVTNNNESLLQPTCNWWLINFKNLNIHPESHNVMLCVA